ncbi:hypothetical protein B0H13DRAFT_1555811, partial [Mycena leptocephala]
LPDTDVCLDVHHFKMRYMAGVLNGIQNPHHSEVAKDVRNAILKKPANKGVPAQYWTKDEQEVNILAVYEKYEKKGGIHLAQLKHVRNGCLARRNQSIAADGSRMEGSHKGWNGLQRAVASGLELQNALCSDFAIRRNTRCAISRKPASDPSPLEKFVATTFGSHHVRLVNKIGTISNEIV